MESKWLEDFLCLARLRNFSRASDARNVTQPAFSRRIRALERWLGVQLFDRRTFPVTLTLEGKSFQETAENILSELYGERARFQGRLPNAVSDLRISAATTLSLNFIPKWLRGLEPALGPLSAQIITPSFNSTFDLLADGDVDVVLQYAHPDAPTLFENSLFDSITLATEDLILVSPKDKQTGDPICDPAVGQGSLPYMGYSSDGYFSTVERMVFSRNPGQSDRIKRLAESPTSEFLKRMSLEYSALALVPESCAHRELESGALQQVGGESWTAPLEVHLYRAVTNRRPLVKKLWDMIEEEFDEPDPRFP